MSDKCFVPASGESYRARRATGGEWLVQKDGGAESRVTPELVSERLDHQAQRIYASVGGARRLYWIYESRGKRVLSWPGGSMELDAVELGEGAGTGGGRLKPLKLTMPGKVVAVKVAEGDLVEADQGLVIVEAMKMENLLLAPARARVAKVHVSAGDRLESGSLLITFESAD